MRLEFHLKNLNWFNKPYKKNASASHDILYNINHKSTMKPDIMPDTSRLTTSQPNGSKNEMFYLFP